MTGMDGGEWIDLDGVWMREGNPWVEWTTGIGPITVGLTRTVNLKRWWGWLKSLPTRRTLKERAACLTWTLATGRRWRPIEASGRSRMLVAEGWTNPRMELRVGDLGPPESVWVAVNATSKIGRVLGVASREAISGARVMQLGPTRRIVMEQWNLTTKTSLLCSHSS